MPDTRLYGAQVVFWLALLLAWSGIVLRQLAIRTLGKFFVLTVITQANQPVITTGPYRLIRHPSYLGALLTIIGVAVALNSLPGAVLLILLPCVAVFHRIKLEESYLSQHLGQPYRDYITHTKKLLPFVW